MSFSSQFAISVELTRLIPSCLTAASTVAETLMKLARDLQISGSDIVIEADLADLFGRSRIEPHMASTFRTIVAKNATSKLCEGISLESGPGPTTIRALAPDQTAYFSTVIQCSFLTAVLKRSSLASALKNFFDKQAQDAPAGHSLRASPSEDGISGFLQACEDQTSLYNWTHQLCAVAAVLGYAEPDQAAEGILPTILHGLLSTLPLSQHFPEEYIIQIESGTGECWIVVWAHYILGLSILVKTWNNGVCTEVPFGLGPAQIIIDARSVVSYKIREPSLTLLRRADETGNEPLFSFKPDPDESKIESIYRVPAKGYGKIALLSVISNFDGISATATEAIVRDMTSVTCALVLLVSNSLGAGSPTYPASGQSDEELSDEEYDGSLEDLDINSSPDECDIGSQHELSDGAGHLVIEKRRLLEAAQFIFNRQQINYATVSQYTELYTSKPLTRKLEPPRSVKAAFKEDIFQESYWARLVDTARYLSILIIAFAHVRDLNACDDLMLHHQIAILIDIPLAKNLRTWDGISLLDIDEFTWMQTISLLIISHTDKTDHCAALLSDRGWSIYLSTLSLDGPYYTDTGFAVIKKGTPFRNGVYRHSIVDGLDKGRLDISDWQVMERAGGSLSLHCSSHVTLGRPFCGEGRDAFVVTLRMSFEDAGVVCMRRTGYCELFSALWSVQRSEACEHPLHKDRNVVLAPGFVSVAGFGDLDVPRVPERVLICLTANNEIARWRALLGIAYARSKNKLRGYNQVMLRGQDCCLDCVISQTALRLGKWFIIL